MTHSVGKDVGKQVISCFAGEDANWHNSFRGKLGNT